MCRTHRPTREDKDSEPKQPFVFCCFIQPQVFEEFDEDVQNAEAAEAAPAREDKDSELKPFHHKQKEHGAKPSGESGEEDDDDDEEVSVNFFNGILLCLVRICFYV